MLDYVAMPGCVVSQDLRPIRPCLTLELPALRPPELWHELDR